MKKLFIFLSTLLTFSIFLSGCTSSPEVSTPQKAEEVIIFSLENFNLVGFWKIEQTFLLNENGSDWVEVSVPIEKYKEFEEWCGGSKQGFYERLGVPSDSSAAMVEYPPAMAEHPAVSIIPSPALPSGFVPNGVCYLHRVEEIPGEGKVSSLMEMSLQGVAFLENETFILIKEPEHSYYFNFTTQKLELITGYFEKEGDTQQN